MCYYKRYNSVHEMAQALSDEEFARDLQKRAEERILVKSLTILRNKIGLTQREVAVKMGVEEEVVLEIENSKDADIVIEDIKAYLKALAIV